MRRESEQIDDGKQDSANRQPADDHTKSGDSEKSPPDVYRRRFLQVTGAAAAATLGVGTAGADHQESYDYSTSKSPEELVELMTLDEKVRIIGEEGGQIPPVERLDIPDMWVFDGPLGVRHDSTFEPQGNGCAAVVSNQAATNFPAPIAHASTFNPELIRRFGQAIAREAKALDLDLWLGPGMNIVRVPELGRSFEYYGEDPYLASRMAVAAIESVEENGILAVAKHYVANNQEGSPLTESQCDTLIGPSFAARRNARHYVNAVVSERALREIYMPAFRSAVEEADVSSVMAAYNRINGTYAAENRNLLLDTLKDDWNFDGFVISDAQGTRPRSAQNGLDVELPLSDVPPTFFGETLKRQVQAGIVEEETVDDKALRLLRQMDQRGVLNGEERGASPALNTDEHQRLARRIAAEGTVLLQNKNDVLPLDLDMIDHIAVIGHKADEAKLGGGGSSRVNPPYSVSPLQGIREYVGDRARVDFERGENSTGAAVALAREADIAIVFGNGSSTEGHDRADITLDGNQNQLITDVAAANDQTSVILNTGGAVTMPWIDDVPVIMAMWYPGMEDGRAATDVLFGEVTPGGKLPVTFGEQRSDYPASEEQEYPGVAGRVEYTEGVFVGYRYFDQEAHEPLFPFGHGLSYTEFEYSNPRIIENDEPHEIKVKAKVQNVGDHEGKEVLQVYVHDQQASVQRPPKELKAFEKVELKPRQSTTVTLELNKDAFAFYDGQEVDDWVVEPGWFTIMVGSSSRDIRKAENIYLSAEDGMIAPSPSVSRKDDGSAFTGGSTNRVEIEVEANHPLYVRDSFPVDWTVVEGDSHTVKQIGNRKYIEFDQRVDSETPTYFVEAPAGITETEPESFGPVEVSIDRESWSPIERTSEENVLVGSRTTL